MDESKYVDLLERLVGCATVSADSNLSLIEFVSSLLAERGIASRLTFDDRHDKANLFATVGPSRPGGIVLSGHTDVVPVSDQKWSSDPFVLRRKGDLLHGRGSSDMKGFIAVAVAAALSAEPEELHVPLHLALSYDEEVGCLGAPRMLRDVAENLPRPAVAIIGEPTSMRVANSHKGMFAFRTAFTGRAGHSSATHLGMNAIDCAAEFVRFLGTLAAESRDQGPHDPGFEPPYTTFNVGQFQGGTAVNIIASSCEVLWEFRPIPGANTDAILSRIRQFTTEQLVPRMRRIAGEANIESTPLFHVPQLVPAAGSAAESLVRELIDPPSRETIAFGTEAGLFQQFGIPAVVIGPGDIAQAHRPDEYVALEQLDACATFLRKLIAWAASDKAKMRLPEESR